MLSHLLNMECDTSSDLPFMSRRVTVSTTETFDAAVALGYALRR